MNTKKSYNTGNSTYLQELDLMFITQSLNQSDVAGLRAVLGQETKQGLAPACIT